jgi:hypothetical protein
MFRGAGAAGVDRVQVHLVIVEDVPADHGPLQEMDIVHAIDDACGVVEVLHGGIAVFGSRGKLNEYPYKPKEPDADGYVRFQLWDLMYKLGKYCGLGCEPPFETVILIDENNLRDVE